MHMSGFEDAGGLLLNVYRLSHESPLPDFQDACLGTLQTVLPFDSSMWGAATYTPGGIDIHTLHLYRQPTEMLAGYESVKHLDTAAAAMAVQPNATRAFDASACFDAYEQAPIRAYGERFDQRHFFITSTLNPVNGLVQWVTLFRSDAQAHCTETERSLLALLAPHLQQAMQYNRVRHLDRRCDRQTASAVDDAARGQAVADLRGAIHHATPQFDALLQGEWHGIRAGRLPEPLLQRFAAGQTRFVGRTLAARCEVAHGLLFVKLRPCCLADGLSPREWQVAWLVARGLSYKEIARQIDRAPATVRNHIQSIYRRLEVGSIAELIARLQAAAD